VNTVERMVAAYFQLVRGCLTASDVKVLHGNNRQFDLLAYDLRSGRGYHVEAGVTHEMSWCPTPRKIETLFKQKFFGVPKPKEGKNTDHAKKKTYLPQIKLAYRSYGFSFQTLSRVWCCWTVKNGTPEEVGDRLRRLAKRYGVSRPSCELLSLRDTVIPELTNAVGRSNYDDDILRMVSLFEQREKQIEAAEKKAARHAAKAAPRRPRP
jgi:hypothetical protein